MVRSADAAAESECVGQPGPGGRDTGAEELVGEAEEVGEWGADGEVIGFLACVLRVVHWVVQEGRERFLLIACGQRALAVRHWIWIWVWIWFLR